jgi:hypothetical protein
MSDDDRVPVGAVAPPRPRLVGSIPTLDALWVWIVGLLVVATAFLSLGELRNGLESTGDPGLRVFSVGAPIVAIAAGVAAAIRKSVVFAAAATGMLAPAVSLVGLASSAHFLDRAAAFADVGAAVGVVTAIVGVAALARWFVYHPVALQSDELRPSVPMAWSLASAGLIVGLAVMVAAISDEGATTAKFVGQSFFALIVALVTIVAAAVRTLPTFVLAASAAMTQVIAVVIATVDLDEGGLGTTVTLWTSLPALIALATVVALALAATRRMRRDDVQTIEADTESWRWTATD